MASVMKRIWFCHRYCSIPRLYTRRRKTPRKISRSNPEITPVIWSLNLAINCCMTFSCSVPCQLRESQQRHFTGERQRLICGLPRCVTRFLLFLGSQQQRKKRRRGNTTSTIENPGSLRALGIRHAPSHPNLLDSTDPGNVLRTKGVDSTPVKLRRQG